DVVKMLGDRPCDRETVVRARAATDLVEHDARATCGAAEDGLRFFYLDPRRSPSSTTSERRGARRSTFAVSFISTMNVLSPRARLSLAPTRVSTRSTTPMCAFLAGTKEPICAKITVNATCRINVDLPAMLGPVTSQ